MGTIRVVAGVGVFGDIAAFVICAYLGVGIRKASVTTTTVLVTAPAPSTITVPPGTTTPASFDVPTLTTPCREEPEITLAQAEAPGITPTDLAEAADPNSSVGSWELSMIETICQGIAATMPVPCIYSTTNGYGQIVELPTRYRCHRGSTKRLLKRVRVRLIPPARIIEAKQRSMCSQPFSPT